jgi:hypothetical protein
VKGLREQVDDLEKKLVMKEIEIGQLEIDFEEKLSLLEEENR